jgi:hypothetical protein
MFNQDKADAVCILLEEGQSLRKAAESQGESARTILNWTKQNPNFFTQYTRAREIGYLNLADEIVEISDEADISAKYNGEDVVLELSAGTVARNRLRIDTRKWLLAKMLPKIYGEKLELSGDAANPIALQEIRRTIVDPRAD